MCPEDADREDLFRCFSQSSGQFCSDGSLMHNCWNATDESIPLVPVPEPWNEVEWYASVKERFQLRWWKNHPVSGNLSCMLLSLNLALKGVDGRWFHSVSDAGNYIVDADFQYPYFANNVFLMRFDRSWVMPIPRGVSIFQSNRGELLATEKVFFHHLT